MKNIVKLAIVMISLIVITTGCSSKKSETKYNMVVNGYVVPSSYINIEPTSEGSINMTAEIMGKADKFAKFIEVSKKRLPSF